MYKVGHRNPDHLPHIIVSNHDREIFEKQFLAIQEIINTQRHKELQCFAYSHLGYCRKKNEDNYILDTIMNTSSSPVIEAHVNSSLDTNTWHCIGVFDGMGGGACGEVASYLAASEFINSYFRSDIKIDTIDNLAFNSFKNANRMIIDQNNASMYGTTGTVIYTNGDKFKVYHIGDSRAYLFRDNNLFQITKDQTLAAIKVEAGIYSANDPRTLRESHLLTSYIGCDLSYDSISPTESEWLTLQNTDCILLCSDGLYDMCSDNAICEIMREALPAESLPKRLVNCALTNGGKDNITCITISLSTIS